MQIVKVNDIIEKGEAIVHYDIDTGLIISATIDSYFTYFIINDSNECEFVSAFPISEYVPENVGEKGETIVEVLINGAKKLSKKIQLNKVNL